MALNQRGNRPAITAQGRQRPLRVQVRRIGLALGKRTGTHPHVETGTASSNPHRLKIGRYPQIGLPDARRAARVLAGAVARGEDPTKQRAEERRRTRATLSKLLAEDGPYETHLRRRGLVNRRTAMSSLRRGLLAHMTADVNTLSRSDIIGAIEALIRTGKRGSADDLRKFARTFCEWAVAQGLTEFNVMAGLRSPSRTRQQRLLLQQKGKALSDGEIVAVWRAAQRLQDRAAAGEAVTGALGGLVQLALLTGLRRGELAQLERDRHILTGEHAAAARGIDGERIHLPSAITKTMANHDIALTPLMRTVIAAQPRTTSALLFPSRRTGGRLKNWVDLVMTLRRDSGIDFQLHDLRRTCRTLMSRLEIAEDIAELAIGHQRADLVQISNAASCCWRWRACSSPRTQARARATGPRSYSAAYSLALASTPTASGI
jgi:integrase